MKTKKIMKIATGFGFDTVDSFNEWVCRGYEGYTLHKEELAALYTDGDAGVAILSLSEIDPDNGLMIELVNCRYCNFDLGFIEHIHDELLQSAFSVATSEMLRERFNDSKHG